jgi:hypothetical protein
MEKSKLAISHMLLGVFTMLVVSGGAHAQAPKLSEFDERLIYSRAYEATIWSSPALAVYSWAADGGGQILVSVLSSLFSDREILRPVLDSAGYRES